MKIAVSVFILLILTSCGSLVTKEETRSCQIKCKREEVRVNKLYGEFFCHCNPEPERYIETTK